MLFKAVEDKDLIIQIWFSPKIAVNPFKYINCIGQSITYMPPIVKIGKSGLTKSADDITNEFKSFNAAAIFANSFGYTSP
jgi:hypothetical protein